LSNKNPVIAANEIVGLMAAMRGPDEGVSPVYKASYTAPIRLWLLGSEAYKATNYAPVVADVSTALPTPNWTGTVSHYLNHIKWAVNTINRYGIAPADATLAPDPLGGFKVGNHVVVCSTRGFDSLTGRVHCRGKIVAIRKNGQGFVVEFMSHRHNPKTRNTTNGVAPGYWANANADNLTLVR
jgi:hypothetical protein